MGAIGIVIKNSLELTRFIPASKGEAESVQRKELLKLLRKAELTAFGQRYNFSGILEQENFVQAFQKNVPIHTYDKMSKWWQRSLSGETNVTWPGKMEYFALSSGTTQASTKHIPVTKDMLKAIQRASIKQIMSLAHCNLPRSFFEKKDILMLGGSTHLDFNGIYYAGDLSGITTGNLPFWFQPFYKPGKKISATKNWQQKLDTITRQAHQWDVVAVVGVPSWIQLLFERIIAHYQVKNIHEVWPNLKVFTHGGVSFEPYRRSFESLLGKPLIYLETYLASEGFIAYQARPENAGMRMLLRNGIFYEFIPFDDQNFTPNGDLRENVQALTYGQVEENRDYALLLSTCAGAWRYLIGDVIHIVNKEKQELRIIGRTRHYLSLTGEHLSVGNMNRAIELVSEDLNIKIKEFAVAGIPFENVFAHHWFIAADGEVDRETLKVKLDEVLKELNDDYRVERNFALREVIVDLIPLPLFIDWLRRQGKEGAQVKFPRVFREDQYKDWISFLETHLPTRISS